VRARWDEDGPVPVEGRGGRPGTECEAHLGRYLAEFDFRYNTRKLDDAERADENLLGAIGKRLTYRRIGPVAA
jgi:hypothetical protein